MSERDETHLGRYKRALIEAIAKGVDEEIMRPIDSFEADRLIIDSGALPPTPKSND